MTNDQVYAVLRNKMRGKTATRVYLENDKVLVKYHSTFVVSVSGARVTLQSGGWKTVTTKRRMNDCLHALGSGKFVRQQNHIWLLCGEGTRTLYFDGMEVNIDREEVQDVI